MMDKILVPINGLSPTLAALDHALSLDGDHEITLLHVIAIDERDGSVRQRLLPEALDEQRKAAQHAAGRIVMEARDHAAEYGVRLGIATEYGHPADRIGAYAEDNGINRIVMGSQGRSWFSRLLLGSPSEGVIRQSPIPVTTIHDDNSEEGDETDTTATRDIPLFRGIN